MNILVTGNYSTGSSAVYDYLREFNNIKTPFGLDGYEHAIFYIQNGLIDLENILFSDTGYISTDAAIRNFLKISKNIYDYDYKYYGGFKKYIGKEFLKMTNDFVDSIALIFDARTIGKNQKMRFSLVKGCGQIVFAIIKKYKIRNWGMAYKTDKGPGYVLKVSKEQFLEEKKKYISRYLELCKSDVEHTLYDHLLLPINVSHLKDFPSGTKLILVDRDPRDVYCLIREHIINNPKTGFEKPPFPINNVDEFVTSYLEFRRGQKFDYNDPNILVVRFEDFVLKYAEFAAKISEFCGISEENHAEKLKYFNPAISANNIHLFKDENDHDIKVIEKKLKDYLYDFSKVNLNKIKKEDSEVF